MPTDLDFWLVMASLVVTAIALGRWINRASDDWLHTRLEPTELQQQD